MFVCKRLFEMCLRLSGDWVFLTNYLNNKKTNLANADFDKIFTKQLRVRLSECNDKIVIG